MTFDTWFRASSYATVACGAAALAVVGGVGWATGAAFAALLALAWSLEGKRWQLSERAGLLVMLLSLPLFYLTGSIRRRRAAVRRARAWRHSNTSRSSFRPSNSSRSSPTATGCSSTSSRSSRCCWRRA